MIAENGDFGVVIIMLLTVCQTLAMSPALSRADNMFMGRELRKSGFRGTWQRQLDRAKMEEVCRQKLSDLGLMTIQNINQTVETLSGGQRQGVAVVRAAAFCSKVIILDNPWQHLASSNPKDYTMADAEASMTDAKDASVAA